MRRAANAAGLLAMALSSCAPAMVEATGELVELPEGAIVRKDLYEYATVLKYRVIQTHRGALPHETVLVAHYNPHKPRGEAADEWVTDVGGNVKAFVPGERHRMVLEPDAERRFEGGIVNLYYEEPGDIYWAVRTDYAD